MKNISTTKDGTAPDENGIALLYAVIVSAIVIMLGASITSIVTRQYDLVITSGASTRAFTAADTGLECAMYHDERTGTSSFPDEVDCAGATNVSVSPKDGDNVRTFKLDDINGGAEVCAVVRVQKNNTEPFSRVEARGFNNCIESNRNAERALRSTYN